MKKGMLSLVLFVFSFNLYAASALSDSILKHRKAILKLITELCKKRQCVTFAILFASYFVVVVTM